MKRCSTCKQYTPLSNFHKYHATKDGLAYECKKCVSERGIKFHRTKNGLVSQIYSTQKFKSKKRNHQPPTYTKEELKSWLFAHPKFSTLFNNWVKSNYDKKLTPSCDRLDNGKGYSFDNLRLVTWHENDQQWKDDIKAGRTTSRVTPVKQYTKNNVFIKKYASMSIAARDSNTSVGQISGCCKRLPHYLTANGFVWSYA